MLHVTGLRDTCQRANIFKKLDIGLYGNHSLRNPYLSHGLFWEIFNVFKCDECYLGVSNIHTDKKFALFFPYKPL